MRLHSLSIFAGLCILVTTPFLQADDVDPSRIRFNDHIRPILSEHCLACHGRDAASREADLRLDDRESAIGNGAILPGHSDRSELIARITTDDPDLQMPPGDAEQTLSAEQKALLIQWINEGAEWQDHWAFLKPVRPEPPRSETSDQWAQNAIDYFVWRKLDELQLQPGDVEDRYVLARRAALDVTGLPPDPESLKRFIDDSSNDAWEDYIDRLLQSERAGEHRARYWLDAARYGDTHGMHVDNYREIWPYRDWVVRAFNNNMPFDQFVTEQLAGDLLPNPTQDQLIATGFSRCNITTSEGGAIPEEVNVRYMVDRVETTATVFLGLTAGCAVCHDHKYDPISQREFYQLGAFFNNTTQPAMDGNQKDSPPVVTIPRAEFEQEWNELKSHRNQLRQTLSEIKPDMPAWWKSRVTRLEHPIAADNLMLSLPLTEGDAVSLPESAAWETEHPAGRRGMRFGDNGKLTVDHPAFRTDEPLTISFWYRTPDRLMATTLFDQVTKTEDKKDIGWRITGTTQGGLTFELHDGQGKQIRGKLPGEAALTPRAWQHVCVRYSGGMSNSSVNILVNGQPGVLRNSTENLIDPADVPATPLKIAPKLPTAGLSDVRIYHRWLTDEESQLLAHEFELKTLIESDDAWNSLNEQQRSLARLFHQTTIQPDYVQGLRDYVSTQQRRDFIYSRSTTTLVMQERPTKPRAWVLNRGEYDQRRDEVNPWIPAVLNFGSPGFESETVEPNAGVKNRLDLAHWIAHPDHPLTARVMANRLWQSVFGVGLVRTSEDFGTMGERPSHPELLDWLAVEFVESGWNVNHILKLILTSAAYRQNSFVTPKALTKDPDNRFLSRGPRLRLDAEVLRDQALAVSGLLKRTMGGPSVKPYQPAGLWKVVAITGSNTRVFKRDSGDALYRRSVYSFWKRTSPPPSMAAFNAPTREQCTVRRERTNTPVQALVLLNDPQFVECARRLAENTLNQVSEDQLRAEWMLRTVLSQPADPEDVTEIIAAVSEFRSLFEQQPEAATELICTGETVPQESLNPTELAAWTLVANTLMNRDDFVNK